MGQTELFEIVMGSLGQGGLVATFELPQTVPYSDLTSACSAFEARSATIGTIIRIVTYYRSREHMHANFLSEAALSAVCDGFFATCVKQGGHRDDAEVMVRSSGNTST